MRAIYQALLLTTATMVAVQGAVDVCSVIQTAFLEAAEKDDQACRCFQSARKSSRPLVDERARVRRSSILDAQNQWIGCTRQTMPSVFRALNALNETMVEKLWIWDSLITILPNDIFAQVRPRSLIIESSSVSLFREGVFAPLATRLRSLQLKGNIIKKLMPEIFQPLHRLILLDLSLNKIEAVRKGDLDALGDLQSLVLNGNSITEIDDGAFANLKSLKKLNLADNNLTNITRGTFRGLDALEELNLDGNRLANVDWTAFTHMKQLKSLDFGTNRLTTVELRGLDSLERLFLNNNSIQSLKNVSLRDLSKLGLLSLDRNSVTAIDNDDLRHLSASPELKSLSLAYNCIKDIQSRAFESVHQLETLSLQNNVIASSSLPSGVFRPLTRLKNLFLSSNKLTTIEEKTFDGLSAVEILALDHNELVRFHPAALDGIRHLVRFYLNRNKLTGLNESTLQALREEHLYIIDLSENDWEWSCENLGLAKWVVRNADKVIHTEHMKWLPPGISLDDKRIEEKALQCATMADEKGVADEHSVWITVLGVLLGVVSVLILMAIVVLYMQDGRTLQKAAALRAAALAKASISPAKTMPAVVRSYDLRRVPSDMVTLIPRCPPAASSGVDKKHVRFDVRS